MNIEFSIDNYLRLSWQDILLASISTLIIVLVARHFFWNKLLAFLDKRKAYIQKNLQESEQKLDEAYQLRNAYQHQMDQVHVQAQDILTNARIQADHESKAIIAKAQQEADYIERKALDEIEKEKMKAEQEMKEAISDVAIMTAGQILGREINEQDQQYLIDNFIDQQLDSYFPEGNPS